MQLLQRLSGRHTSRTALVALATGVASLLGAGSTIHPAAACNILESTTLECSRPGTPTSLVATAQSPSSILLTWTNTAHEATYIQVRSSKNGVDQPQGYANGSPLGHPDHHTFTDLSYHTSYCYSLRAERIDIREVSETWSDWACATTPYPPLLPSTVPPVQPPAGSAAVPSTPTLVSRGDLYVEIGWSYAKHDSSFHGFKIYRDGQAVGTVDPLIGNDYLYTDVLTGLEGLLTHTYKVCAVHFSGDISFPDTCSGVFTAVSEVVFVQVAKPSQTFPFVTPTPQP